MAARACTFVTMTAISALSTLFVGIHNLSRQHNIGLGSMPVWAPGHFGHPPDNDIHEWFMPTMTLNDTPSPTRLADTTSPSSVPFTTLLLFFVVVFGSILMGCLMACKKHRQADHQHDYMAEDTIGLIGARYDGVADSQTSYGIPFIPATSLCPSPQTMANSFPTFAPHLPHQSRMSWTPHSMERCLLANSFNLAPVSAQLNARDPAGKEGSWQTAIPALNKWDREEFLYRSSGNIIDNHFHQPPVYIFTSILFLTRCGPPADRPAAEHDYGEPDDYEDDDDDAHGNPIDNGTGNGTSRESKVAVVTDSDAQRGSDAPAGSPVPTPFGRHLNLCRLNLCRPPPPRLLRRLPPPAAAAPPLANRNDKPCLLPPGERKESRYWLDVPGARHSTPYSFLAARWLDVPVLYPWLCSKYYIHDCAPSTISTPVSCSVMIVRCNPTCDKSCMRHFVRDYMLPTTWAAIFLVSAPRSFMPRSTMGLTFSEVCEGGFEQRAEDPRGFLRIYERLEEYGYKLLNLRIADDLAKLLKTLLAADLTWA
ncbi:hypothetical protein BKA62DRAFT_676200 [Auriculariales sp. MPI-PUGE-AT-0066]|nr:hypothetical protein BKA62DRAFT_676200 [Auriculariales sp. MPI-PUGE-AT-0066]